MARLTTRQDLELRRLRQAFFAQMPERVRAIEAALRQVSSTHGADPEAVDVLFHLAHRLCGSAGIYGHPAVCEAAGALECAVGALRDAQGAAHETAALAPLVDALKHASAEAPSPSPAPAPSPSRTRRPGKR